MRRVLYRCATTGVQIWVEDDITHPYNRPLASRAEWVAAWRKNDWEWKRQKWGGDWETEPEDEWDRNKSWRLKVQRLEEKIALVLWGTIVSVLQLDSDLSWMPQASMISFSFYLTLSHDTKSDRFFTQQGLVRHQDNKAQRTSLDLWLHSSCTWFWVPSGQVKL